MFSKIKEAVYQKAQRVIAGMVADAIQKNVCGLRTMIEARGREFANDANPVRVKSRWRPGGDSHDE